MDHEFVNFDKSVLKSKSTMFLINYFDLQISVLKLLVYNIKVYNNDMNIFYGEDIDKICLNAVKNCLAGSYSGLA